MSTHLFISYVAEDLRYFEELERHLRPFRAQGRIAYWHMGMVPAGDDWRLWRRKYLDQSQVILCLVSSDYLAQAQQEIAEIWQRQRVGAQVIPVLVRPALLNGTPFEMIQPLPADGTPISLCTNRDIVLLNVLKGVLGILPEPAAAQSTMPPAPEPVGWGQSADQPNATLPVGRMYQKEQPMPPPTPSDFPKPVGVPASRVTPTTTNAGVPLPAPALPPVAEPLLQAASAKEDIKSVRILLDQRLLTDSDFDAFVLDHYPYIYRKFSSGMDRIRKTNLLLESIEHPTILSALAKTPNRHLTDNKNQHGISFRWLVLTGAGLIIIITASLIFNLIRKAPVFSTTPNHDLPNKKTALIIGNANYRYVPRLKTAVLDAHDLADRLSRMGFTIILQENESKAATEAAMQRFIEQSNGSKIAIFMYFGHGVAVDGVNYLVPIDAEIHHDIDIPKQSVDLNRFIESVQLKDKFGALLFVLDTCTKNISLSSASGIGAGLEKQDSDHKPQIQSSPQALKRKNGKQLVPAKHALPEAPPHKDAVALAIPVPLPPQPALLAPPATGVPDAGSMASPTRQMPQQRPNVKQTDNQVPDKPVELGRQSPKEDSSFRWQGNDSYFHTGKREDRGVGSMLATFTPYIENSLVKILSDNVMIIYSSQPDENAIDQLIGIKNGPFAHALLSHIGLKGQPLVDVVENIRRFVYEITQGRQQPWHRGTLTRDIYLVE